MGRSVHVERDEHAVHELPFDVQPDRSAGRSGLQPALLSDRPRRLTDPGAGPGVEMSTTPLGGTNSSNLSSSGPATIDISVPEDADVLIQNKRVKLTGAGSIRHFVTPFLAPGAIYSYDIRATWTENGREVTRHPARPGQARRGGSRVVHGIAFLGSLDLDAARQPRAAALSAAATKYRAGLSACGLA